MTQPILLSYIIVLVSEPQWLFQIVRTRSHSATSLAAPRFSVSLERDFRDFRKACEVRDAPVKMHMMHVPNVPFAECAVSHSLGQCELS
jgi:hypothetical protein